MEVDKTIDDKWMKENFPNLNEKSHYHIHQIIQSVNRIIIEESKMDSNAIKNIVPFIKDIICAVISYCNNPAVYESLIMEVKNETEGNQCK